MFVGTEPDLASRRASDGVKLVEPTVRRVDQTLDNQTETTVEKGRLSPRTTVITTVKTKNNDENDLALGMRGQEGIGGQERCVRDFRDQFNANWRSGCGRAVPPDAKLPQLALRSGLAYKNAQTGKYDRSNCPGLVRWTHSGDRRMR